MIEEILPATAIAVEARSDRPGVALFPEEEEVVVRAVERRRQEFATARACARAALERLGFPAQAVPTGASGEPRWPTGVVGSITHCDGYRACAVARDTELLSVGIDAEPNLPLPDGVLADIALPEERAWVRQRLAAAPATRWDRLLFSAKEAVYKTWFPLAGRWLGFEDARLAFDLEAGAFSARLLVPGPRVAGAELRAFHGRWIVREGIVLTAIAQPAATSRRG